MTWDHFLQTSLDEVQQRGLHRKLRCASAARGVRISLDGREVTQFASNDYLGLAGHPALAKAAAEAAEQYGSGSGASRLISGNLEIHEELESALACMMGTEAAIVYTSGYAAALGVIPSLVGRGDVVILDKLSHASLVDAARLSGAEIRVFGHNRLDHLESRLHWASQLPGKPRILIVTEAIFSMDGDAALVEEILELKQKHSAWLLLDEAHALGVCEPMPEAQARQIEVRMATLGKSLGSSGGFVCGSRKLRDFLINRSRSFIFSTAPCPAASAAALAAVKILSSEEGQQLRATLADRRQKLAGFLETSEPAGAIVPRILGRESRAVEACRKLLEAGIYVPAVRYPTVARGAARLRITLSANHDADDLRALALALHNVSKHD